MGKFMDKTMDYMMNKVSPKMSNLTKNSYLSGLQAAILKTVPLVLISSVVTVYNVVRNYVPALPAIGEISSYTFGLIGLVMGFLVPFYIAEKQGNDKKFVAGMMGLAVYMMAVKPTVTDDGYLYNFSYFGAGGMFIAIFLGIIVALIFSLFKKIKVFKEDSPMPDFCREWFDVLLPGFVTIFLAWLVIFKFDVDLYAVLQSIFQPIVNIGNTFVGALLILLIPTIFYTMGISGWVFNPIYNPIQSAALAANMAAWEAGTKLPYIFASGCNAAYLTLGGRGNTLPLNIYFLISKSRRLKNLGRTFIVPSVLNINEPIMYANVVWNPILMIPCWITAILNIAVMWVVVGLGLVVAPHAPMAMWYLPVPIPALLIAGIPGAILCLVILALDFVIWYPFFKVYEKKVMIEDGELTV